MRRSGEKRVANSVNTRGQEPIVRSIRVWSPSSRFAGDLTPFRKGSGTPPHTAAEGILTPGNRFLTPWNVELLAASCRLFAGGAVRYSLSREEKR